MAETEMNRFAINTVSDELELSAEFCRSENIGIEITDFAFPWNLDDNLQARIDRHKKTVEGITPLISHGPFFDLIATSLDPSIVAVAKKRHETALAASQEIGASIYIAHTNYMPLIREVSYRKSWVKRMLGFWLPLADTAGRDNIVICLENVWEPQPYIQAELVTTGNHPHLQASFDNGHALVFSDLPSYKWIEVLGQMLAHCHLHDNNGEGDEHKPVGDGKENWKRLMTSIAEYSSEAVLVAESDRLDDNKVSIGRMKELPAN
jgi:sugar phosphate isomerase/epimerase